MVLPAEWDTVIGVVTLLQELRCTRADRHTSTHLDAVQWNSKGHRMCSVYIISVDTEEEGRRKRRRKKEEEHEDERGDFPPPLPLSPPTPHFPSPLFLPLPPLLSLSLSLLFFPCPPSLILSTSLSSHNLIFVFLRKGLYFGWLGTQGPPASVS